MDFAAGGVPDSEKSAAGLPCDYHWHRGLSAISASNGGIQWPCERFNSKLQDPEKLQAPTKSRNAAVCRRKIFHGRCAKLGFLFDPPRPSPNRPIKDYPFVLLLSGRGTSAQWHTNTRTGKSACSARFIRPILTSEINPVDAAKLGLASIRPVAIVFRRGAHPMHCMLSLPSVQTGQVSFPCITT